jgi:hypothetical protein
MTAVFSKRLLSAWACIALSAFAMPFATAQNTNAIEAITQDLPPTMPAEYNGDVRDLPPVYTTRPYLLLNEFEAPPNRKPKGVQPKGPSGANNIPLAPMPAASANFAGIGFCTVVTGTAGTSSTVCPGVSGTTAGAGWPPDTNGDVGPTVYVQAVNTAFGIFDKTLGTLTASFTEDQLWSAASGATTPCTSNNQGDPVVLHDAINDRWILTDFGFALDASFNPVGPFYECIAVSKTSDPVTGGWSFFAVRMDAGNVPTNTLADYPKFGLWNDGCLYMGANGFDSVSGNYAGAIFASFNTANLYAGTTLTSSVGFLAADANGDPFGMFPANALGSTAASMPPAGTLEYFVYEPATTFNWEVRKFAKGANCGGGGTLGPATGVTQASYGYPAYNPGGGYTVDMVGQSGTTNRLDSLGDRMMQKVQYRRIGSTESLWVVHTTCGSGHDANFACVSTTNPVAQPQWAQINVTGGTVNTTPVQQQIYAPDSTLSRWMGSLAVDASGDMALGYSTSSSSALPGVAYSGRLAGDPLNSLSQTEQVLIAGAASQNNCGTSPCQRWGDYSSMSIDPADDCTFWYTNEYYDTTAHASHGNWQTRIGAFKFPNCVGPAAKLVFTQQPNASYASNATITVKVSVEDASGNVVTTDTSAITIALQGGTAGAVLGGTTTVNAVAGVATFNLSVDLVGSAYKLHATDGTLTAGDSSAFNITPGAAAKLVFTTQPPASSQAGATFGAVVNVEDAAGNTVTTDGSSVTLALTCACATVGGNTVLASAGVATFSFLNIGKAGTGYHLKATDSNGSVATATSNAFNITTGPPASITLTTQPAANSNIVAATTIAVAAQVKDSNGNAISGDSVTLAIGTNAGGATLSVTVNPLPTDSSGNVIYTNVSLDKAGSGYTLKVTEATGSLSATSNAFNIVAGAPATITFNTQPTGGSNITPATTIPIVAQVTDNHANAIVGDNVTLAIANNAGGATLSVTANPVATDSAGKATFANVSLDKIGTGYTLRVTESTNSLNITGSAFNIVVGAPAQLVFTTQPTDVAVGGSLNSIVVTEEDAGGNTITTDSVTTVDFSTQACGAPADLGSTSMSNGVATLSSVQVFNNPVANPPGLQVTATDATLDLNVLSNAFAVQITNDAIFTNGFETCTL